MYRNCIYCAADLGANESVEHFPVGRSVAFDGEKGRLWAVCPRCARWNLAPIEERWEAIEDAERLFCAAPTRVQSGEIGLAKLRDGTRLVRVGEAPVGELVAYRYAATFASRWRRANHLPIAGLALGALAGLPFSLGFVIPGMILFGASLALGAAGALAGDMASRRIVHRVGTPDGESVPVRVEQLGRARLRLGRDAPGLELVVPPDARAGRRAKEAMAATRPIVLRGDNAMAALGRGLVRVNWLGGDREDVWRAQQILQRAGSPHHLLMMVARRKVLITGARVAPDTRYATTENKAPDPRTMLAVEMALHAEWERRALAGELEALRELWRQAEEIAGIADRLPDGAAPPEPPRMHLPG